MDYQIYLTTGCPTVAVAPGAGETSLTWGPGGLGLWNSSGLNWLTARGWLGKLTAGEGEGLLTGVPEGLWIWMILPLAFFTTVGEGVDLYE